jgi:hypothetical protein
MRVGAISASLHLSQGTNSMLGILPRKLDVLSIEQKQLVKEVINFFSSILTHVRDVSEKAEVKTHLANKLKEAIRRLSTLRDPKSVAQETDPEKLEAIVDEYDDLLEDAKATLVDNGEDDNLEEDELNDQLVGFGERIDRLRSKIFPKAHTVAGSTMALTSLKRSFDDEGADSLVVTAFQKRPITERLRTRKKRIKWLRTSGGRAYLRKRAMRIRLHKRKDPKRSRLMRKVSTVYKHS